MESGSVAMVLAFGAFLSMWLIASAIAFKNLTFNHSNNTLTQSETTFLTALAGLAYICAGLGTATVHLTQWLLAAGQSLATSIKSLFKTTIRNVSRLCVRHRHRRKDSPVFMNLNMATFHTVRCASLLGIPAEIRNKVYRLTVEHYSDLDCRPSILLRPRRQLRHAMALIRTCRQIYNEAHLMIFNHTLFHVWSRHPFYRRLNPVVWNEIRMIHLVAQINSRGISRISAALHDIKHMFGLRDLYITMGDFNDFDSNHHSFLSVFSLLRLRLKELKIIQLNIRCARDQNFRAERRLKRLLVNVRTQGAWPVDVQLSVSRTLFGPMTKWMGFVRVPNYDVERQIGVDEELVRLPWDGYSY